ncbi:MULTISPECIES: putative immunity protein [Amycolatopsis]|uniref:putative immunity protein n=1 Tax=Amycolatopsis TaxID=1813 RepID=UPI0035714CF3
MAARDVSDVWASTAARAAGHAAATTHVPTHAPHAAASAGKPAEASNGVSRACAAAELRLTLSQDLLVRAV